MMTGKFIPTADRPLRIGTRKSPLALAQAEMAGGALMQAYGLENGEIELKPMLSHGDKVQDRPLAEIGGKALWTKELERALIDDEIDIAVHSMKDVETTRPDHFNLAAMLPRADVRDILIGAKSVSAIKSGARIGTSSPRRAAQIRNLRPDIDIVPLRGNVATRLQKIDDGEADGTLLAAAGLDRLGLCNAGERLQLNEFLPAASQGAIGIDCLSARQDIVFFLGAVNHQPTYDAVMAERMFLDALGGDCHSPVAAHAEFTDGQLNLRGQILTGDGREEQSGDTIVSGAGDDAPARLAARLLDAASPELRATFPGFAG